jgi:cephalosporin hydroxylase
MSQLRKTSRAIAKRILPRPVYNLGKAVLRLSAKSPGRIWHDYHVWYYNSGVWQTTTFLGHNCLKSVSDMWNYQEILFEMKPNLLIEFGSFKGGSTLFFSKMLALVSPKAKILAVDVDHRKNFPPDVAREPNIELLECSSADPRVAERILQLRKTHKGPAFFILDSDHSAKHVLAELLLIRNCTRPGDYVIVEDSNINGHPVLPDFGPGPYEAFQEYAAKYPNDYTHDTKRELKFGFTWAPAGFLIRR